MSMPTRPPVDDLRLVVRHHQAQRIRVISSSDRRSPPVRFSYCFVAPTRQQTIPGSGKITQSAGESLTSKDGCPVTRFSVILHTAIARPALVYRIVTPPNTPT